MKVNRKSIVGFGAVLVAGALALTGCGGSAGSASSTSGSGKSAGSLTVWVDSNRAAAMKQVAADFQKDKGIKINLVVKDFGKIRDDFTAQVPTGKGPDVTIGAHDWIGSFVKDGLVAPVELGDKASKFEKVAISAVTYDSKVYGLPYAIENIAILRNTALADSTPATYDEMIAKGKAAGTKYPFLIGLDATTGDAYHTYPFETSFGGQVFAQNADGSYDAKKLTIGDEAGQKFATWLGAQGAAGIFKPGLTGDLAKAAFNAGESPYFITGPWNLPDAEKAGIKVSVDPIPSAGGQEARPFAGVQAFFVNAKSKNTIAANEFLVNYLATPSVQTALYKAGGRPPALTESFDAAQSDPAVAGFAKVGAKAVPMPSVPEMGSVWDDWGKGEVSIMKGADPVSTWTTMTQNIQSKIG